MNKILIVDENKSIRLRYTDELTEEGYHVITSSGAEDVLDIIEDQKPDLIVMDYKMHKIDGLEALQKIRNSACNMPVILCTTYKNSNYDIKPIGADSFINKSSDLTELKHKIKIALKRYGESQADKLLERSDKTIDEFKLREGPTTKNKPKQIILPSSPGVIPKIQILIIDDDRSIRILLSSILNDMGFDVIAAENGIKGRELFFKTIFDLVITDLEMPGMDGWTLAFHIKSEAPHTPVIMLTGMEENTVNKNMGKSFVDIVIFKPFRIKELEERIHGLLNLSPIFRERCKLTYY